MNEQIPSQEFTNMVERAASAPEPSAQFQANLRARLERKALERKRSAKRLRSLRWSVAFGALLAVAIGILLIGPANVVAALRQALGYIPGFGLVETTGLRVLEEPVVVERDGITFTLVHVVATATSTSVDYSVQGDIYNGHQQYKSACPDGDQLGLPDGSLLSVVTGGGGGGMGSYSVLVDYPPLPKDVMSATLVTCVTRGGDSPVSEVWEIPFQLVFSSDSNAILPVTAVGTVSQGTVPSSPLNGLANKISLSLENIAEEPDGYKLFGSLRWGDAPIQIPPFFPNLRLTDSLGADIPIELTYGENNHAGELGGSQTPWSVRVQGKYFHAPLALTLDSVSFFTNDPVLFSVNLGKTPQPGQTWQVEKDVPVLGYTLHIFSVQYILREGQTILQFKVRSPREINSFNIVEAEMAGGGAIMPGRTDVSGEDAYLLDLIPSQSLQGEVAFAIGSVELNGPWTVEWTPPTVPGAPSPTPIPQACLTQTIWEDLLGVKKADLPAELTGRMLALRDGAAYTQDLFLTTLDGANAKKVMAASRSGSLSPEGDRIAYTDADGKLLVLEVLTGETILLSGDPYINQISWSPDGNWIAFTQSTDQGANQSYVIHPDGTGKRAFGGSANIVALGGWDSFSTKVVALEQADMQTPGLHLYLWDLDSDSGTPILPDETVYQANLSPDGEWIAYIKQEFGRNSSWLYVSHLDGADRRLISNLDENWITDIPVWSPDGNWLAFAVQENKFIANGVNRNVLIQPSTCDVRLFPEWLGSILSWIK